MIINDDKVMMLSCSFCKKSQKNVNSILASEHDICICNECILLCSDIIKNKNFDIIFTHFLPYDIYNFLNKYVIGQKNAKKVLSVTLYNHYNKIFKKYNSNYKYISIIKSNILMIGPTGSGKTLLVRTLAQNLGIPIAMADATTMTEAGYVGEDVENILTRLLKAADNNVNRAEYGIVYIDEVDKISKKIENGFTARDVSGEGVQQGLLKLMEGTTVFISSLGLKKQIQQQNIRINTKNILFIFSGAFSGLEHIIKGRLRYTKCGFENFSNKKKTRTNHNDLIKYGMIPEFMGRITQIITLSKLNLNIIIRILNDVKNSLIMQYQKIFMFFNIIFIIKCYAQIKIAKITLEKEMGARGIKSIIESLLLDIMFIIPSQNSIKKICIESL